LVGPLFMWSHCNILGKRFKAEPFWLFTDKIYVYRGSEWVLYHTAVKALVLVPIIVECNRGRKKCEANVQFRAHIEKVSWDFGPSSESFSFASWVLRGLLNKFDNDLACRIKLLLHLVWNLLCLAQFLHAIKGDNLNCPYICPWLNVILPNGANFLFSPRGKKYSLNVWNFRSDQAARVECRFWLICPRY